MAETDTESGYPPGAYPIVPPLPEHETETISPNTTTATSGTETKRLTPEQQAAIGRSEAATTEAITGTEEVRKHKEALAKVESDMAEEARKAAEAHEARVTSAVDAGNRLMDTARTVYQQKQAKLDATPTEKFFRDNDTWGNARRGIGLGLAGLGDSLIAAASVRAGHGPTPMHTVNEIVEGDLAEQRAHINRLKDDVVMARTGIADADAARKDLLADVDLKGAAALKRIEALTRARLAAAGMSQPEIDQHQAVIALKQGQAKYQQDYLAPTFEAVKKGFSHETGTTTKETNRETNKPVTPPAIVRNPVTGQPMGIAPSARAVPSAAQQLAATEEYKRVAEDLAKDIEKNGRILSRDSKEGKKRLELINHFQAISKGVFGLSQSDAQQQLDQMMSGGSGVLFGGGHNKLGIEPHIADPDVIRSLAKSAVEQTEMQMRSMLTPLPPQGAQPAPTQPPPFNPGARAAPAPARGPAPLPPDVQNALNFVNSPESRKNPRLRDATIRGLRAAGVEVQ